MTISRTGQTTNFSNQGNEFSVTFQSTDGAEETGTAYIPNFKKWHGYYRQIPELRAVINKFASWTFGRKIIADEANQKKLKKIKGFGKDSARAVLKNQWRTALVCGDSFAHIIEGGNLKPLNADRIAIVANKQGILIGYEQQGREKLFEPEEIYHLSYERISDEIHGIPFVEALEELIVSRNEALADMRVLYHRNIKPIRFFEVETSDATKLTSVENSINEAYKKSENVVIPAGVIKEIKEASTPHYSTLDSLPYIKFLVRSFVTSCGMPEVVMGWGEETTEASAKVIITSYEQEIWDMKLYNQEMAEMQLGIKFDIEPAPSLMDELKKDLNKDGAEKAGKPVDVELNHKGKK